MAESDVSAVKVYNYICGIGGFAEFSQLLKHPSPLAKKPNEFSAMSWFELEKQSGSFDSNHALVMTTNQYGKGFGIRIDLRKRMCLKYATPDSCRSAEQCKFWHICKEFIEGTCKRNCGRSHDFHDEDNKGKTAELGFEKKTSSTVRGIVAGSLPQVCLSYLKNECLTSNCPYLHICPRQVRATPCECSFSHDFANPHNKNILEQYGFRPPRKLEMEVVRCNILVPIPKQQKPIEANKRLLELSRENQMMGRRKENENSSKKTATDIKTEIFGSSKSKTPSEAKSQKSGRKPVTLSGLIEETNKSPERVNDLQRSQLQQTKVPPKAAVDKVINYIFSKGGFATLSELLHPPSPLAKKFLSPEQEMDAKIWLQVQAQSDLNPRISVLENNDGDVFGARVYFKEKICLSYASKGSCSKSPCPFWHICKGYLERKCSDDCGLSHDFHDESNIKKVEKLGFAKHPSGTIRNIVANSLPQVCNKYLENECFSKGCPYLHICSHLIVAWQKNPLDCSCGLAHDLQDDHNLGILKQYKLVPQPSKLNIVLCNILIPKKQPKKQRSFEDGKNNLGTSLSSLPQTHLNKFGSQVPPLMSLPLTQQNSSDTQLQDSRKGSEKKKRKRQRWKKKKTNQHGQPLVTEESQGVGGESSDSDSDNEDTEKPDLYPTSKFNMSPSDQEFIRHADFQDHGKQKKGSFPKQNEQSQLPKGLCQEDYFPEITANQDVEENLINLSDDDWQGADTTVDDLFTNDLLSQVDDIFFDDWFGPSNVASSLSQGSAFSFTSDQSTRNPETVHSEKSTANLVFQFILKEHNGEVPFSVISEKKELFPLDITDVGAWFRENKNRFMTIENKVGEIEAIRAFNPKARICFHYLLTKKGCRDSRCFRYHVCKHYLANGICPFGGKCRHSHSHNLRSPHNKKITEQLKLDKYSEKQLRILISASVPEVCLEYNRHSCQRGLRCNGIHICKYFVMKNCKKGDSCPLDHKSSLETPAATLVLGRYNLTRVPPQAVLSALLVRDLPSSEKTISEHPAVPVRRNRELVTCQPPYICMDNLLGQCSKEPLCDHYHCSGPYMWQYRYMGPTSGTEGWKAFMESENEVIEKQFCDVNITVITMEHIMISPPPDVLIDPGDGEIQIDFDDMKATTSFGDVQLQRLSTKSAVFPTDHALSTRWIWYWLDESNSWKEYGSEPLGMVKHEEIESKYTSGNRVFRFEAGGDVYRILFRQTPMCQQNTKSTISKIRVRRRPVFRSTSEIQALQRPLELPVPLEPQSPLPTEAAPSRVPPQWTDVPENEEYNRVSLSASSDQYKLAESLFRQSMSGNKAIIVSIERVQNPFMWEKYARKKEQLERRSRTKNSPVNEKLLFHGADHQMVDTICEENIDWRALDEDRAASFGQGTYFTSEAVLSNLYCKEDSNAVRYMFLVEVLVGSFAKGEPSMKRPPYKDDSLYKKELYDSCVDNVEKPTIYVLFNADQYYPSFLIKYKMKSKVVC